MLAKMGTLAVAFLAVFMCQAAVLGDVTKELGHDKGELGVLFQQIVTVSDNIYETLYNTPNRSSCRLFHHDFDEQIVAIVNHLEELASNHDEKINSATFDVLNGLRQVHAHLRVINASTDDAVIHRLEINAAIIIKSVVREMEPWVTNFEGESPNDPNLVEIKSILNKFSFAFNKLYENTNSRNVQNKEPKEPYGNSDHQDAEIHKQMQNTTNLVNDFEAVLGQFKLDSNEIKLTFLELVREYLNNVRQYTTPLFNQHCQQLLKKNASLYPENEVKHQLCSFMKSMDGSTRTKGKSSYLAFKKATLIFKNRFDMMVKINTPSRILALRIYSVSEFLVDAYESKPYDVPQVEDLIEKISRKLGEDLERFVSELEVTQAQSNLTINLKRVILKIRANSIEPTFIHALQEASSEVLKYIMVHPDAKTASKFLDILNMVYTEIIGIDEYVTDIETWSSYLLALTNRLSMFVNEDINIEDINTLVGNLTQSIAIMDNETSIHYKESSARMKIIMADFESEKYPYNSFLQKIALELNWLAWSIYNGNFSALKLSKKNVYFFYPTIWQATDNITNTDTGKFPKQLMDMQALFMWVLEVTNPNHGVTKGLLTLETPQQISLTVQNVADRLNRLLHLMVPGFQTSTLARRANSFSNMLDIVAFRLNKISVANGKSHLINEAYRNLVNIQNRIVDMIKQPDLHIKVGFSMYVQDAVMELKKLSSEPDFDKHPGIIQMCGDFLYGIRNILNQVQYDFQFMKEQYNVKTLNMQIGYVAHYTSSLLHRVQSKPELKHVVLIQAEVTAQEVHALVNLLEATRENDIAIPLLTKYKKVLEQLSLVATKGWDKPYEDLCVFLDMQIREIVTDLEHLAYINLEHPKISTIYQNILTLVSSTMARLENVHYYEYYNFMTSTQNVLGFINTLNVDLSKKLGKCLSSEVDDFALQTLQFANNLEEVAQLFENEALVLPKGLNDIICDLRRLGRTHSGIDDLRAKLNKYTINVASEVEDILTDESLVGAKNPLVAYTEALEQLNHAIEQSAVRSQKGVSLYQIVTNIDEGVHYLTKTLEFVSSRNNGASDVLHTEHRRIQDFLKRAIQDTTEENNLSEKLLAFFAKLDQTKCVNCNNVDALKSKLVAFLKYFPVVLRELSWVIPELQDHQKLFTSGKLSKGDKIFSFYFLDFLKTIQEIRYNIETRILAQQVQTASVLSIKDEGLDKYYPGASDFAKKYASDYYGIFPYILETKYLGSGNSYVGEYATHETYNTNKPESPDASKFTTRRNKREYETPSKPEIFSLRNPKYFSKYTYRSQYELPQTTKYDGLGTVGWFINHQSPTQRKFGSSNEKFEIPEYYGNLYESPTTYRNTKPQYDASELVLVKKYSNENDYQYAKPKYSEEYASPNSNMGSKYQSLEYFIEYVPNKYESKDLAIFIKINKNAVREVIAYLKTVPLDRTFTLYIRQLVQILDDLVQRLQKMDTNQFNIRKLAGSFKQIRTTLKKNTLSHLNQIGLMSNSIAAIFDGFGTLAGIVQRNETPAFMDIFRQLMDVVRSIKYGTSAKAKFEDNQSETIYQKKSAKSFFKGTFHNPVII